MSQLGWIDFSRTHHDKVMMVMDMFKEQGVVDELGLGTIRDSLSDLLFPGTSTIQTRAKYFLLIPWIFQEIEASGKTNTFLSELENLEIQFIKVLRSQTNNDGVIGRTLPNANPKRKPSSIYWNGLKTYGILNFKGSISDYAEHIKRHVRKKNSQGAEVIETDGNVPGDDKDANHLYQYHLWCQLPRPPVDWTERLNIELSHEEAKFIEERVIRSNDNSLWSFTLKHIPQEARTFSGIMDFLSVKDLPEHLMELVKLAVDFNTIMKGALIRYNLMIQRNRENGRLEELVPVWESYWREIQSFDWKYWDSNRLWQYCPFTQFPTKRFVQNWIDLVRARNFNEVVADQLIKDRELRLKGIRRARLHDKAVAQKQETFTGISIYEDGTVEYLSYRWNTVQTFLNDIQRGLAKHASTE